MGELSACGLSRGQSPVCLRGFSLRRTEREEILRALDRFLETAKELLQVFVARDEVDFRSVDDQKIGSFVAEEEVLVCAGDFLDIFKGDVGFLPCSLLGQA